MGQGEFLQWFKESGEWHCASDVARQFDRERRSAQKVLAKLVKNGDLEVKTRGEHGTFWYRYICRDKDTNTLGLAAQESQTDQAAG